MSVHVKVFGRQPGTVPNKRQVRWPASENLQRRKPREKVTDRAALGISGRTGGRFFVQPERYGTEIADWGKVTLLRL